MVGDAELRELRIFDRWPEMPSVLLPLRELLWVIRKLEPGLLDSEWQLLKGAYGYGEEVVRWEALLETEDFVTIPGETLWSVIESGTQYFDNAHFRIPNGTEVGIADGTYLFLKGSESLLSRLMREFQDTTIVPPRSTGNH